MPDDPVIDNMDPVLRMWMFYNWLEDQNDDVELVKNHAYLLASFDHPKEVEKLTGGGNTHVTTDEEFETSTRMITEDKQREKEESKKPKRRRKKLTG